MSSSYAAFPGLLDRPRAAPVLALTRDARLTDLLHRLAAAGGAELEVRADPPSLGRWAGPGLVIIGADLVGAIAAALPRRTGLVVVDLDEGDRPADSDRQLAVWQDALALGVERVAGLPSAQEELVDLLAETVEGPRRASVVAVVGGSGGAGASVLSAALAVVAAGRDCRTLLVDLDPLGGGTDLLLGAEAVPGLRWPDLAQASGRLAGGMLREALPRLDELSVLSWGRGGPGADVPIPADASAAVAEGARRGFDLLVLDLPRAIDGIPTAWLRSADLGLVVIRPTIRSTAAATRVIARLAPAVGGLRAVVAAVDGAGLAPQLVADTVGLPLQGLLRAEPGLGAALERGEPPGLRSRSPLAQFAVRLLDGLPGLQDVA